MKLSDIRLLTGEISAKEFLSCWVTQNPKDPIKVIVDVKKFREAGMWGILLADAAGHMKDSGTNIQEIRDFFNSAISELPVSSSVVSKTKHRFPSISGAKEVLCAWDIRGGVAIVFPPQLVDSQFWGMLLASTAISIADSFSRVKSVKIRPVSFDMALDMIVDIFNKEIETNTSPRQGETFMGGESN